eukprot:7092570-Pyramimonas_sp.AAC.1
MWFSPQRRAHSCSQIKRVSRVPTGRWFGKTQDCEGATVTLIRRVEFSRMACWHDSYSSRRHSQ